MTRGDYSGTPLPRKLGIGEGHRLAFVGEPDGFRARLGALPAGAEVSARPRAPMDVIVLFATRRSELDRRFVPLAASLDPAGGLWVAWPKKSAPVSTDLSFEAVQAVGLQAGLVDNKSASIDEVWQALRFVVRRADRDRWPAGLRALKPSRRPAR